MVVFEAGFSSGIGEKVVLRVRTWLVSQNIAANTSVYGWQVVAFQTAPTYSWCAYGDAVAVVHVNDSVVFNGKWAGHGNWDFRNLGAGAEVAIASGQQTIVHNADGQKHVRVTVSASDAQFPLGSASLDVWDTATLPTIPRESDFTVTNATADGVSSAVVTISPASPNFRHHVRWKLGSAVLEKGDVATSTSMVIPTTWNQFITTSTSASAVLEVETWSSGGFVGKRVKNFTVSVPTTYVPSFTVTGTQIQHGSLSGVSLYLQGYTGVKVIATSAAPGTYASLASWTVSGPDGTANGTFANNTGLTVQPLRKSGSQTYTVTVTDSRGRSTSKTFPLTVVAYAPPAITSASAVRSNSAGTAVDDGLYIKAQASTTHTAFTGNTITRTLRWRRSGTSTWSSQTFVSGTAAVVGAGTISPDYAYDVQWEAADRLTTSVRTYSVGPASYLMSMDAASGGVAVGGPAETSKTFRVYSPYTIKADMPIQENGLTLERLYGAGWPCYNFGSGYLIQTDITPTENTMWMLDVRLNTYAAASTEGTGEVKVQGYAYGDGSVINNTAATSTVGRRDVYAFFYANTLHLWFRGGYAETAHINLRTRTGGANHRILSVANAAMPTSGVSRSVTIVPEVLGYKPQAHATFTYSPGSTAGGASRVLATGTITVRKPSIVFFSGNLQAITTTNAAAWFDVEIVGVGGYQFRVHSYGKAIHTAAAWSRGLKVDAAGTYTVRVVARVDAGAGAMQFEDIHAEVWTF